MGTTKILVTITPDDDIDVEEYMDAISDACHKVASRPTIGAEIEFEVEDVTGEA